MQCTLLLEYIEHNSSSSQSTPRYSTALRVSPRNLSKFDRVRRTGGNSVALEEISRDDRDGCDVQ